MVIDSLISSSEKMQSKDKDRNELIFTIQFPVLKKKQSSDKARKEWIFTPLPPPRTNAQQKQTNNAQPKHQSSDCEHH